MQAPWSGNDQQGKDGQKIVLQDEADGKSRVPMETKQPRRGAEEKAGCLWVTCEIPSVRVSISEMT